MASIPTSPMPGLAAYSISRARSSTRLRDLAERKSAGPSCSSDRIPLPTRQHISNTERKCLSGFRRGTFDWHGNLGPFCMRNALPKLKEQVRFPNPAFLASATASTARVPTFPHKVFVILITPGADILYLRFGREIESFSDNLKQLEAVVNQTNRQRPRRTWRNPDDECRLALQPVSQAVGDFRKTLEECEKLLNDHERFRRDEAGFVDNVVWHLSTQRDVDILRERVQFHTTKVRSQPSIILLPIPSRTDQQSFWLSPNLSKCRFPHAGCFAQMTCSHTADFSFWKYAKNCRT